MVNVQHIDGFANDIRLKLNQINFEKRKKCEEKKFRKRYSLVNIVMKVIV